MLSIFYNLRLEFKYGYTGPCLLQCLLPNAKSIFESWVVVIKANNILEAAFWAAWVCLPYGRKEMQDVLKGNQRLFRRLNSSVYGYGLLV